MPKTAQSGQSTTPQQIDIFERWSQHDVHLLVQLCIPKPRRWSQIIKTFQQYADHVRSAEAITKQWGLIVSQDPSLNLEAPNSVSQDSQTIQHSTQATKVDKPDVTKEARKVTLSNDNEDPALNEVLLDGVQLNQEQFYLLQQSMDSGSTYEWPSQIVARLKQEEGDSRQELDH